MGFCKHEESKSLCTFVFALVVDFIDDILSWQNFIFAKAIPPKLY